MIGILISALVIGATLWIVARHDAEIDIKVLVIISALISILGFALSLAIGLFALPIMLFALGWALVRFCYVSIAQAAIVSFVWLLSQIGLGLLMR